MVTSTPVMAKPVSTMSRVELFNTGDDPLTATPVATTTTAGGGFYEFDNLTPGSYFVFIPEEEFQAGGDLENFV